MARVLVTNDDGIDAPGLHHLARFARDAGHTVTVAAPAGDASGTSASITYPMPDRQVELTERALPGLAGVPAYAIAGSPALITLVAMRGAFGPPPELVFSGVNRGANTGHAILHSGTVGAALTAAANGCPAAALSLKLGFVDAGGADPVPLRWEAATHYLLELVPVLLSASEAMVLNVNAPNMPPARLPGLRHARLAAFGAVQTTVESGDGFVRLALEDTAASREPGTDTDWLARGYATVSAVTPILERPQVDLDRVVEALG